MCTRVYVHVYACVRTYGVEEDGLEVVLVHAGAAAPHHLLVRLARHVVQAAEHLNLSARLVLHVSE